MPEPWYPSEYYIAPHFSTMPGAIRIVDAAAPELGFSPGRFWAKALRAAIARWSDPLGFAVHYVAAEPYSKERITVGLEQIQSGIGGWAAFEYPPCESGVSGCAWIHVDEDTWNAAWLGRNPVNLKSTIAHEFGHSLGFGHGGNGVMAVPRRASSPNAEEIAAAKDYWGFDV